MIKGDDGDKAVEMLLKQTEQEIIKIYDEASKGCYAKLQKHLRAFERKDAEKRKLKDAGLLSEDEYNRWKHGQIMIGQRWQDMVSVLAEDMVNADKLAVSVINGHIPEAYAVNANYGTYQIEHGLGIDTSFVLYDRHTVERLIRDDPDLYPAPNPKVDIPKDRRWNKKQINSQVTQAILQGEPVKTLAKRIFPEIAGKAGEGSTPKKNAVAAMRTARTAMTGAQNAGRVAAYSRAEELGIQMLQEWVSAHDGHTRESHLDVDGEQVPVGSEFSNECRYPGDPGGPPEEVYNCRCTLVPALKSLGQIKDKDYKPSEREIDIAAYEEDKAAHKMSFTEWQAKNGKNFTPTKLIGSPKAEVTDSIHDYYLPQATRNKIPTIEQLHTYNDFKKYIDKKFGVELDTGLEKLKGELADDKIPAVERECQKIITAIHAYRDVFGEKSLSSLKKIYLYDSDLDVPAAYFFNRVGENDPLAGEIHFRDWGNSGRNIFHELGHAFQDSHKGEGEDAVTYAERIIRDTKSEHLSAYAGASSSDYSAEQFSEALGFGFSMGTSEGIDFISILENLVKRKR